MPEPDPHRLDVPQGHYIGGRLVRSAAGTLDVLRPSDGQRYAALDAAGGAVVDEAAQNAHRAWRESAWATGAPRDRARVLYRWAELIEADPRALGTMEGIGSYPPA